METPPPPNPNNQGSIPPPSPPPTSTTKPTSNSTITANTTTTTTGPLPKFFILHSLSDKTLGAMSAFVVDKSLQGLVGTVQVKKLRSGDLQVETPNDLISKSLMRVNALDGVPISVTPHRTLNSSKGVIVSRDLLTDSEEDILKNLEAQGVTSVKRIMLRRDGGLVPSNVHVLTFNTPVLPGSVKAGYLRCTVRPYIPNPLRCFLCQRYGHSRNVCRGSPICARCAKGDHDFENCQVDPVCVNCQGSHPAYSRSCPKWQEEKAVQQYRVDHNVPYPVARRAMAPISNKPLYSAALQKKMVTSEVQTDVTIDPFDDSPIMQLLLNSSNTVPCSQCGPPRSISTSTTTIVSETERASTSDAQTRASESDAQKQPPVPQKEPVMASKGGKGNKPAPQGQAKKQTPASQKPLIKAASEKRVEMPAPERQAPKSKKSLDSGSVSGPARGTKPSTESTQGAISSAPNSSSDMREDYSSSESEIMSCVEGSGKRALSPGRERSPFRTEHRKKSKKKARVPVTPP